MPATTTIPALRAALKTALEARSGLAGVQVSHGVPRAIARESIMLGDVDFTQQAVSARGTGQHSRRENYTLALHIWVDSQGNDQKATSDRAFALMAEIESQLRTDPSVSGTVHVAQIEGGKLEEQASDNARAALLTVNVACLGRI